MPHFMNAIRFLPVVAVILSALSLGGCLFVERKEYHFKVNPDGSGSARITFINIMSAEDETSDPSTTDYAELVTKYLKGTAFETEHPFYSNVRKRLFEAEGMLNGEITFNFASYEDVGLYRYRKSGPWMYYTNSGDFNYEQFASANGDHGGENMPVVFWPEAATEFEIKTAFEKTERKTQSLLGLYRFRGTN